MNPKDRAEREEHCDTEIDRRRDEQRHPSKVVRWHKDAVPTNCPGIDPDGRNWQCYITDDDDYTVARVQGETQEEAGERAARILACVAACAGMADPVAEVAALRSEAEAFARNLRGKQATAGATYEHLIRDRDALKQQNAKLLEALTKIAACEHDLGCKFDFCPRNECPSCPSESSIAQKAIAECQP